MGLRGPRPHGWDAVYKKLMDQSYLDQETGCYIWTGRTAGQMDYGYMRCDGVDYYIHRLVYERMIGPLPDVVRHTCDTPRCWNPDHLRGGTHQDNVDDKMQKGRYRLTREPDADGIIRWSE